MNETYRLKIDFSVEFEKHCVHKVRQPNRKTYHIDPRYTGNKSSYDLESNLTKESLIRAAVTQLSRTHLFNLRSTPDKSWNNKRELHGRALPTITYSDHDPISTRTRKPTRTAQCGEQLPATPCCSAKLNQPRFMQQWLEHNAMFTFTFSHGRPPRKRTKQTSLADNCRSLARRPYRPR